MVATTINNIVLFFRGAVGYNRLIFLILVFMYLIAQFSFEQINQEFICYEPANIILPLLVIVGFLASHYSASVRNVFPSIALVSFLILMIFVIHLIYINGFVRYMIALYWSFLLIISTTFTKRIYLMQFLVICLLVSLFAMVQLEESPVPKTLWYVWYPLVTGAIFMVIDRNNQNRKQLEKTQNLILQQQNEISQLFDKLPVMVNIKDKNNHIIRANGAFADFMNQPVDTFNDYNLYEIYAKEQAVKYHLEDLEIINSKIAKRNVIEKFELEGRSPVWIRADKFPYYGLDGAVMGVLIVSMDITTEILAKQNLAQSDKRFEIFFNEAPHGIVIADLDDRIVQVNQAFCDLLQYDENELLGNSIETFIQLEDESQYIRYKNDQLVKDKYETERQYIRKDGEIILTRLKVSVIRDEQGTPLLTLGMVEDITMTKKAEEKLKEYSRALEDSNKELEQFAYAASHDLKEPLRMVKSYIEIISRRYGPKLDEAAQEFIGYAVNGVERMNTLITDLLQYSKVGRTGFKKTFVQFDMVLFRVLRNLRMQVNETKSDFIINADNPHIYINQTQFALLLQNLISNAIKYRKKNVAPKITIDAQLKDNFWEFSITDNGIGMDKKNEDKIFQIFHRLHAHQEYQGTGVGLALCKRIIHKHNGEIWAKSEKGVGTTFYFTLPYVEFEPETTDVE